MRILASLVLLALAACSSPGTLTYAPQTAVEPGPAVVAAVTVQDRRDEKPNRVATIRGGFGNPLKVLDTTEPVGTLVQQAFTRALEQRRMLAPNGPFRFQVTLETLYGDQFLGRKAELKMSLSVLDRAGRAIYSDSVSESSYVGTFFDNGIFAGIEDLRASVEKLMSLGIDHMLDKAALRRALTAGRPMAAR